MFAFIFRINTANLIHSSDSQSGHAGSVKSSEKYTAGCAGTSFFNGNICAYGLPLIGFREQVIADCVAYSLFAGHRSACLCKGNGLSVRADSKIIRTSPLGRFRHNFLLMNRNFRSRVNKGNGFNIRCSRGCNINVSSLSCIIYSGYFAVLICRLAVNGIKGISSLLRLHGYDTVSRYRNMDFCVSVKLAPQSIGTQGQLALCSVNLKPTVITCFSFQRAGKITVRSVIV